MVASHTDDGTIEILEKSGLGTSTKVVKNGLRTLGVVGGVVDALSAWDDVYIESKNGGVNPGTLGKALFKTAMAFAKVNPIVSLGLSVLDITGVTDDLFKW